ncbi:MAG: YvcK family protein [Candidatus Eremiobacteraeota bacterium]|nr:YvcK family protein [Candidatus Eremiobacteraeota bacterium]
MSSRFRKWLTPGIGIKRWLLLSVAGLLCFTLGILVLADVPAAFYSFLRARVSIRATVGVSGILAGLLLMVVALYRWFSTIFAAVAPNEKKLLVDVLYERRQLEHGLKIVAIGGGTGLSCLLRGLKPYSSNLVAVVTVSDDGGSSGRLSKELGVLPPGDIRNCLVSLADDESLLSELFDYRFQDGHGLEGHSFGNLFLAALTDMAGDFEEAIKMSSQILATRGRVLPATLATVTLCARYADGSEVRGESAIPAADKPIREVYLDPPRCQPPAEVLEAIAKADAIVLGPGSLFTSVIPNLLVDGIVEALQATSAPKIYVCNVMTQPGETETMGAADHLKAIQHHAGTAVVDYAVVNIESPAQVSLLNYQAHGSDTVAPQMAELEALGVTPVAASLVSADDLVRHDSTRLASALIDLIARHKSREAAVAAAPRHLRAVK